MRAIEDRVRRALAGVLDPELDRPVTELDFVQEVRVDGDGDALVVLRLPTYWCSPNFAFLMVADAHDAVRGVPGVRSATIRLDDHFASAEINGGVAGGRGFAGSFPGMAEGELDELRITFWRKAHAAAQERVAGAVLRTGRTLPELTRLTLAAAVPGPELDRLRRRRADLGLPADDAAPLLLDATGRPMGGTDLAMQLRMARTTRISIEGNAAMCGGLLAARYGVPNPVGEETPA
jgi:metal-sulfur cluster biosynthetic enzyme